MTSSRRERPPPGAGVAVGRDRRANRDHARPGSGGRPARRRVAPAAASRAGGGCIVGKAPGSSRPPGAGIGSHRVLDRSAGCRPGRRASSRPSPDRAGGVERPAGSRHRGLGLGRHHRRRTTGGRRPSGPQPHRHRPLRRRRGGPAGATDITSAWGSEWPERRLATAAGMAGRPPGLRAGRRRRHQRLRWRPHRLDGLERSTRRSRAGQQRLGSGRKPGHRQIRPRRRQ